MPPKAPKVKKGGYQAARERMEKAQMVFRITVPAAEGEDDVVFTYAPYNVPIRVQAKVRDVTGMSADQYLYGRGQMAVDTYANMWWISRLHDDPTVDREAVWAEFEQRCPGVTLADITDEIVEDGDDDPKA